MAGGVRWNVKIPIDAADAVVDGAFHLVGADDESVVFLAVVARRARIAHDRELFLERGDLFDSFGDDVLVLNRFDRHLKSDHGAELRGVRPGRVDNVVGDDPTLLGDDFPSTVWELVHVEAAIVAADLGAELAGARSHGVGGCRRVGPPVTGRPEAHCYVGLDLDEGGQFLGFGRRYEVRFDADRREHAVDVTEPVHLVLVARQANRSAAVPARVHAGLFFNVLVELDRVVVNLGHVEVADEVRDETGGMPCGARGQLVLFDEDGLGPALVGEEIEESDSHCATADDGDLYFFSHGFSERWVVPVFH